MTARQYSPDAWARLGELLKERREEMDPRYGAEGRGLRKQGQQQAVGREAFAAERGINAKMSQDVENSDRQNFTAVTLRDTIARAYGVTYDSILDVLDEAPGADLVAAPGSPPRRPRGRHRAPAATGPLVPLLSPDREDRARPYADQIAEDRRRWQLAYAADHPGIPADDVPEPAGSDLFTSPLDIAAWDENADVLTAVERIWLIAELRARRAAAARERQAGTG